MLRAACCKRVGAWFDCNCTALATARDWDDDLSAWLLLDELEPDDCDEVEEAGADAEAEGDAD